MRRYFMTIPEAVQLVLQASILGQGGEIFMLDMGEPVRILDLAVGLLRLYGLEPEQDIKIIYSGIRPGEKINEELFLEGEHYQPTKHPKILVATSETPIEGEILEQMIIELIKLAEQMQTQMTIDQIQALLPRICYYIDGYENSQRRPLWTRTVTPSKSLSPSLFSPHPSTSSVVT
jgi:FlaA1/EpsC-like NDP-sugar epimerase